MSSLQSSSRLEPLCSAAAGSQGGGSGALEDLHSVMDSNAAKEMIHSRPLTPARLRSITAPPGTLGEALPQNLGLT